MGNGGKLHTSGGRERGRATHESRSRTTTTAAAAVEAAAAAATGTGELIHRSQLEKGIHVGSVFFCQPAFPPLRNPIARGSGPPLHTPMLVAETSSRPLQSSREQPNIRGVECSKKAQRQRQPKGRATGRRALSCLSGVQLGRMQNKLRCLFFLGFPLKNRQAHCSASPRIPIASSVLQQATLYFNLQA